MQYLLVQNETPVELTGYLETTGTMQFSHSTGNLVDNGDALESEHTGTTIQIKLMDFVAGGRTWVVNASHQDATGGTVNWSRGTDHAYYDFSEYMSSYLETSISSSDGTSTKEKVIDIKTKPKGSLPDYPL